MLLATYIAITAYPCVVQEFCGGMCADCAPNDTLLFVYSNIDHSIRVTHGLLHTIDKHCLVNVLLE